MVSNNLVTITEWHTYEDMMDILISNEICHDYHILVNKYGELIMAVDEKIYKYLESN